MPVGCSSSRCRSWPTATGHVKPDVWRRDVGLYRRCVARKLPLEKRLGARVREVRQAKRLSQMDMVRDHEWTLSHWQKIERGDLDPRLSTVMRVAESLGITVGELLKGV